MWCLDKSILVNEKFWVGMFFGGELLLLIFLVFVGRIFWRKFQDSFKRMLIVCSGVLLFFLLTFISIFFVLINVEYYFQLNADNFFHLNAAIKNTCYLDSARHNCPQSVEQVISIEDERFSAYAKDAYIAYEYRPDSNSYTLIALEKNVQKGVVFDPRFKTLTDYPHSDDFIPVTYRMCNGKITIKESLPFEGLWNRIDNVMTSK